MHFIIINILYSLFIINFTNSLSLHLLLRWNFSFFYFLNLWFWLFLAWLHAFLLMRAGVFFTSFSFLLRIFDFSLLLIILHQIAALALTSRVMRSLRMFTLPSLFIFASFMVVACMTHVFRVVTLVDMWTSWNFHSFSLRLFFSAGILLLRCWRSWLHLLRNIFVWFRWVKGI